MAISAQQPSSLDMNKKLQAILKEEEGRQTDEKSIALLDDVVKEQVSKLLKQVMKFAKLQIENKDLLLQTKGFLLGRIPEAPFKVDTSEAFVLKTRGLEPAEAREKKHI